MALIKPGFNILSTHLRVPRSTIPFLKSFLVASHNHGIGKTFAP